VTIEAQRIACENRGGFDMAFAVKGDGVETEQTDYVPVLQTPVVDLANYPIHEGVVVRPAVSVRGDARSRPPAAPEPVQFTMNGRTAYYRVTGTVWDWQVPFQRLGDPAGGASLPGFPADVPVFVLPYRNWDWTIQSSGVATCTPRTPEQVVSVCNWAKDHAYQVRPRGIMHGWSPLALPANPPADSRILLVDLTKCLWQTTFLPAADGLPNRVRVQSGQTMLALLQYLENVPGGSGAAPGYSFPHTPAPGNLTVGGVLAIDAHGTAVPLPPRDDFSASYGSMSNQVLELTAVVTDPSSPTPGTYSLRRFNRGEAEAKAFLTHVGRALVVEATLQVVENYNLRCQSFTDISWQTLFAAPQAGPSTQRFADFLTRNGRVEVIWFCFSDNPWLHIWSVEPAQPSGSRKVDKPYNYPFADNVTNWEQQFIGTLRGSILTPAFGRTAARVTASGLDGQNALNPLDKSFQPPSRDIWGPSKNTLLYIQDTTLRVTANGYAIHLKYADVQAAVSDFAFKFDSMLNAYAGRVPGQYPVNSALEIRVTALDDPSSVSWAAGGKAESPVISALRHDARAAAQGWDVALWVDVLTLPGTPHANEFYTELEAWLIERFSGDAGRILPEWSKGWGYTTDGGAWSSSNFFDHIRQTLSPDGDAGNDWRFEADTLRTYDRSNLFRNPLLDTLFGDA
jgi:hypothetical protein